jgi:hypothetical protein
MKKLTLIILLSLSFVSCKKYESKQDCTCMGKPKLDSNGNLILRKL